MNQQYSHQDTYICFEQQCHLSRIITNWDQLKLHNEFNHKVISKHRFDSKFIFKFNQLNEQYRIKVQEDINQLIQYQEDRIIVKIQELFDFFKKMQSDRVQNQIYFDYQLSNSQSIEAAVEKYIKIYYGQIQTQQSEQEDIFLDQLQTKLNLLEDNFINLLEKYFTIGNQYFNNAQTEKAAEFNDSTLPESKTTQSIGVQEYINQTEFISNKVEQMKIQQIQQETYQILHDENVSQQYSTLNQSQQIEQDDLNNIPLKGYKQYQFQQQNYSYPTKNILQNDDDDDRLKFQLPSELVNTSNNSNQISNKHSSDHTTVQKTQKQENINTSQNSNKKSNKDNKQYEYVPKTEAQDYIVVDNPKQLQQKRNIQKSSSQNIFFGKKFDLTNSYQNLNFSKNIQAFSCDQQGIGLIDGILTLQIDAEIRLRFSESKNNKFQAEIGILSVDKNGKMKGSQKYCMNELGELVSNGSVYKGKLKISLNQEYLISYSSYERMLYFIKGKTKEYLDLDKVQGYFKFYIKLYELKVQIIHS
ncbi:unnamed protein product [Paramecium sonneborni]|uniref:Uncharacterized protein n=1 Tax=Paramecium sonneborni TaxID=65129 RepID=A0A8S1QT04_9CILI|nr:unnamed protein product [Paramecium sonneborni]